MAKNRSTYGQRRGYQAAAKYLDRWPFADSLRREYATPTGLVPYTSSPIPTGGLRAWWAADDLALVDTDPVTSWADRVGGVTLEEATNPPTFRTGVLNGMPGVRFSTSGTDDSLQTASTVSMFKNVTGGTVFVVGLSTGPTATFQTFFATDTATVGTDRFSVYAAGTTGYLGQYGRRLDGDALVSKASTTAAPTSAAIIRATADWGSGTYDLSVGGSSIGSGAWTSSGSTSNTDAAKFRLGRSNTANFGLDGDIYEVIAYERVLTSLEITAVEDYLTAKWLTAPGTDATFTGALGGDSADGGSATFAASSTFTGAVGGDNASGASASLTGTATFTGALGGDAAAGGSASFTASSTFAGVAGGDTGDGGSAAFTASSTFTAQVGGDAASGASASFTGTSPDATFYTTAGGDAADGSAASFTGTGTFTGALGGDAADGSTASLTASSAFTANAGGDTANGGSASLTGSATFSGTVGGDSASGAAASFTVTGDATFTATAGGDAADGGTASLTASSTFTGSAGGDTGTGSAASFTGSGTFSTLVATADADGNVALMAGSATFATLDSTSTAEGATVSFVLELPPESGRAEGASPAAPGIRHDNPAAATVGAAPATASSTTGGDGTAPAVVGAAPTTPRAGG